jgi:hypothetical protein
MRLIQTQNLFKAVIMACFIAYTTFLVLPVSYQFSSYDAMATVKQKSSSSSSSSNTKEILLQKEGNENESMTKLLAKRKSVIGAWAPYQTPLEEIQDTRQQERDIKALLEKGFNEYYFVMTDFNDSNARKITEKLLKSADNTSLKIVIILLPPSEAGPNGNYDWEGWIDYFNDLEDEHESFKGFTIDDFNWISTRNDTKFVNNIDYMTYSDLYEALNEKREDVHFYPVIYFEGKETNTVITEYSKFTDGIIAASACYYNITNLEKDLSTFSEIFDDKPIRYVVYPTMTYNYSRQNYNPPSDQLIMATLSIASKAADGILIWRKIDNHVVEDYLSNHHDDAKYLSKISMMERLQIRDEKIWKEANPSLANSTVFQRYCHL